MITSAFTAGFLIGERRRGTVNMGAFADYAVVFVNDA